MSHRCALEGRPPPQGVREARGPLLSEKTRNHQLTGSQALLSGPCPKAADRCGWLSASCDLHGENPSPAGEAFPAGPGKMVLSHLALVALPAVDASSWSLALTGRTRPVIFLRKCRGRLAGRLSQKPEKGRILLLGRDWIRDGDQGRENIHPSAQESHFWELVPRKQSDRKPKLCRNMAPREVFIVVQPRKSPSQPAVEGQPSTSAA